MSTTPVSVLTGSCFGPFYSVVQTLAPPRMRALAAALVVTFNTILGLGLAPPLIGVPARQGLRIKRPAMVTDSVLVEGNLRVRRVHDTTAANLILPDGLHRVDDARRGGCFSHGGT